MRILNCWHRKHVISMVNCTHLLIKRKCKCTHNYFINIVLKCTGNWDAISDRLQFFRNLNTITFYYILGIWYMYRYCTFITIEFKSYTHFLTSFYNTYIYNYRSAASVYCYKCIISIFTNILLYTHWITI